MIDLESIVRAIVRDEIAKAKPTAPSPEHVTIAEYARSRSISESTVRAAIREKRLPCLRIGRSVRVPASAEISRATAPDSAASRARLTLLRR